MKKIIIFSLIAAALGITAFLLLHKTKSSTALYEIYPTRGDIALTLKLNGNVNPRNLLEIKPQIAGRIESILVVEGQKVKKGEVLAWMSSTDRAALLDAALAAGPDEVKKWENVYKPTPVIAPLDGFIIDRNKEPGQTVGTADNILVMADKLIIEANVDETDLRYIRLGQNVQIVLDAYPDMKFPGVIEHIAYQSTVINNVTVYVVKILPVNAPSYFRAGMSATMEAVSQKRENAVQLPADAITYKNNEAYVTIRKGTTEETEMRKIKAGITSGRYTEIISGLTEKDLVVVQQQTYESRDNFRGGPGSLFGIGGKKTPVKK
jgi:membrane fusion protein, macrolide-specific efflux system